MAQLFAEITYKNMATFTRYWKFNVNLTDSGQKRSKYAYLCTYSPWNPMTNCVCWRMPIPQASGRQQYFRSLYIVGFVESLPNCMHKTNN